MVVRLLQRVGMNGGINDYMMMNIGDVWASKGEGVGPKIPPAVRPSMQKGRMEDLSPDNGVHTE